MILTIIVITFFVIYSRKIKKVKETRKFLPVAILLMGVYFLTIVPFEFIVGWLLGFLFAIISIIIYFLVKKGKINFRSKRLARIILYVLMTVSVYTQFFNGIETFYDNPIKYFKYAKGITYKYIFIPPKIIDSKSKDKDYIYSLVHYKNSFFVPESMTQIEIYEGKPCYYWAKWKFGQVPTYYRRYFSNDEFIDSPA